MSTRKPFAGAERRWRQTREANKVARGFPGSAKIGAKVAAGVAANSIVIDGQWRLFEADGEGPAVILLHGSLSSSRQWRKLAERLGDRYRVLAPDLYAAPDAAGATQVGDFTFAQDCAFVQQLIDENGKAHVVGHSWGGVIAAKAAFGRRHKLMSLTLIEPSCFHLLDKASAEFAEIIGVHDRGRALFAQGDVTGAARLFVEYWMGPSGWSDMPARRQETILAAIPRLHRDWAGTLDPNTRLDDFRAFDTRTLLMHARDTRRPSARIVAMLAGAMLRAAETEIASGGHMSPLTNPEPVNDAIETFLAQNIRG